MSKVKRIGVLTSGGDAPGMNAAVRSVVRTASFYGVEVVGIYKGYDGLMNNKFKVITARDVGNILGEGGTMLYSARSKEFPLPEGIQRAANNLREAEIEGLVTIGGDGTFRGAEKLSLAGIPCIGVPATIDNDIASTDYSIGFDTALNTIVDSVDKFRDTSESHSRCAIIEVMGRQCGDLAIHAGIACGAVSVLTTEMDYDIQRDVIDRIIEIKKTGKSNFIVLTAEGVTGAVEGNENFDVFTLARIVEEQTKIETRGAVLAHMQRGGTPTGRDRVLASRLGAKAVELLKDGIGNRVVAEQKNRIVDIDILEALDLKKEVNLELYKLSQIISI